MNKKSTPSSFDDVTYVRKTVKDPLSESFRNIGFYETRPKPIYETLVFRIIVGSIVFIGFAIAFYTNLK